MSLKVSILNAHDLIPSDLGGKTDSYCVIGLLKGDKRQDKEPRQLIGKTAVVENNLNPDYPDNVFELPMEPSQRIYIDVYDEDPGKDDRTCGLKATIADLLRGPPGPHKVTFPLKKKGIYKVKSQNPYIELLVQPPERPRIPIGDIVQHKDQYEPFEGEIEEIAKKNRGKKKEKDNHAKFECKGQTKYTYHLLVVDIDEKDFWVTDKEVPPFVEKEDDYDYEFHAMDKNLLIVPFIQTPDDFKAGDEWEFELGDFEVEENQWLLGESTIAVVRLEGGEFKLLKDAPLVHRKNYTNQQWVEAFPESILPKAEYHEK